MPTVEFVRNARYLPRAFRPLTFPFPPLLRSPHNTTIDIDTGTQKGTTMGLLGILIGGGYRPPPPPPPPPSGDTGQTNGPNTDNTGNTQTSGAGSTQSSGEGAGGQTVASTGQTPTGETTGTQGATQSASGSQTSGGSSAGTPIDASPTRADFSLVAKGPDEDAARAYAIAAQGRERLQNIVAGLAEGLKAGPTLTVVPAEKTEPANAGAAGLNSNLSALRGEKAAGAVLDKVA
jgi:hypothetical protein